jgi:hypothetical protein
MFSIKSKFLLAVVLISGYAHSQEVVNEPYYNYQTKEYQSKKQFS